VGFGLHSTAFFAFLSFLENMLLQSLFSLLFSLWACLPWMQTAAVAQTSAASSSLAPAQSDKVPQGVVCAAADAAEVQRLLADKSLKTPLDFARKFLGRPYVAATLEVSDPEQVVVNLQGLDCATLVETSQALAMTRREGKTDVASYTRNLEKIRYFDGKNRGYTSRLHYLSFWMADLTKRKVAKEVVLPQTLTQPLEIRLNYMSTHAGSYPFLKNHPERVREIAQLERKYSGKVGRFLPKSNAGLSRQQLGAIHDGDIITVVTQKAGLDYSHQGIAFWGNDGKLHMLHASSERKRVIADERTLEDYLKRISHAKGIRVFRIINKG
jgi:putative xylanase